MLGNNNNNNNKKNHNLNFLKGAVLGDKEQGVGIRDKGQGSKDKGSLTCPGTIQIDETQTIKDTSKSWQIFLEQFDAAVVSGSFQKFGKAVSTKKAGLKKDDFVMVIESFSTSQIKLIYRKQ